MDIEVTPRAASAFRRLPNTVKARVTSAIDQLKDNPFPKDTKHLGIWKDKSAYRIRVGQYRIIYTVRMQLGDILILAIDKRIRVYQR
ncbi:type II toxin-antitoxin system RelE/ParE family toxin [Candidatus Uhrbacteria bacterium]|nr:type II toxin-antitoxin system RelE/ParE family toxin [Candidatus Uhrbacteria bacterium]